MLDTLRAWLNGDREYFTGTVLYKKLAGETPLYALLAKGRTDYTARRLEKELLTHLQTLKDKESNESGQPTSTAQICNGGAEASTGGRLPDNNIPVEKNGTSSVGFQNAEPYSELYQSCKKEADKAYKELMNHRAQLLALALPNDFSDVNTPEKIEARKALAIKVAGGYQFVSKLYDRADHVLQAGKLPVYGEAEEPADYSKVPDELVKQCLDNKRKALSKLKKREQTPDRLQRIKEHEAGIKILEDRWHLLKPNP